MACVRKGGNESANRKQKKSSRERQWEGQAGPVSDGLCLNWF